MTGLPDANTASLEDDIRRLIENEFGLGKFKAPEAGLLAQDTAKHRITVVRSLRDASAGLA